MPDVNELAKQYQAFERTDKAGFQRRARLLQSMWRVEQGYEVGRHNGRSGERPLGSRLPMPMAEDDLINYLSETIKQVVRDEVLDRRKSRGKLFSRPRIFNDLLSSQPLCFNLFGELQQDLELATTVFREISSSRVHAVTSIDFEYSPGRGDARYTGDNSAFDVYVAYETNRGGKGFVGIEVKYHENLAGKAARHRSRYDEVAQTMGCFKPEALPVLKTQPLQQIWRDHMLAGIHLDQDHFDDGFFVFLYPRDNTHCSTATEAYSKCLSNEDSFAAWTLQDVAAAIKGKTEDSWIDRFIDRYLNFDKLNQ